MKIEILETKEILEVIGISDVGRPLCPGKGNKWYVCAGETDEVDDIRTVNEYDARIVEE